MKAFDESYDTPIITGKKVAVVGGGNVAMDAARTALRLGADVTIVYRRSEAELPARIEEVHHAKEEGIHFRLLTNPKEILVDDKGWVKGMRCIKMKLQDPDESGRRRPVEIEGSEFVLELDTVIMALGTSPNPLYHLQQGLKTDKYGCIVADEVTGVTSREGIFAGGDAVTGSATVILAMGAGNCQSDESILIIKGFKMSGGHMRELLKNQSIILIIVLMAILILLLLVFVFYRLGKLRRILDETNREYMLISKEYKDLESAYKGAISSYNELNARYEELHKNRESIRKLAYTDYLTELPNRIAFIEMLDSIMLTLRTDEIIG